MNIRAKITEWQESAKFSCCCGREEELAIDNELELVLFAIDELVDAATVKENKQSDQYGKGKVKEFDPKYSVSSDDVVLTARHIKRFNKEES